LIKHYFYLALFLLLVPALAWAIDKPTKLRIGYDNQPPFRFSNAQKVAQGIDIARISAILDHAGIEYEFQEYPWNRILRLLEVGDVDVAMAAAKLKEREVFAWFSNEVFNYGENVLVVKPEIVPAFENESSLSSLLIMDIKIGVRRATSYSDEYEALLSNPTFLSKIVQLSGVSQAIQLTLAGRISGFIAPPSIIAFETMKACLENNFVEVYDLLAKENSETFLMFSKKTVSIDTVNKIDKSMRALNSMGDQYNNEYTLPSFDCPN
jgi:polar amino acid transport system substrate-binding protein